MVKQTENIKHKLEECEKLKNEYLAGWQRAKADFLNYKKKEEERMERVRELTKEKILLEFLKVLDNLERAIEVAEDSELLKGIEQIISQFRKTLQQEGVVEIEAKGKDFDPNFHEAVVEVKVENEDSGKVVEVLEKGYLMNGQLLRPAKVKVSK